MPEVKETRVFWTEQEWDQLAQELYCVRPIAQYQQSDSLVALSLVDMQDIQRVLPEERRRKLYSVVSVKPKMQEAMRRLRAKLQAVQAQEKAAAEAKAREEAEALAAQVSIPNPYELAFAPLVDLIATEVTKRVQAMIAQVIPQVTQIEISPQVFKEQRKPKFGVIGPLGVQAQELIKAFPQVEFITVESGDQRKAASQVSGCDRIIGMTDFMNHTTDGDLRAKFPEKYHRTTGSTASVKRLIGALLHSMQPKGMNGHASPNARHH